MQRDIRGTAEYREAETLFATIRRPGTGQISDATELQVSPSGKHAVFAGTIVDKFEGAPPTRICQVDLTSGDTRVLTGGSNTDRLPKYSPDGLWVAFLSDRQKAGDFQLHLLNPLNNAARATRRVDGWVEYLHWAPDGKRILLGVAGHGADVASGQGAISSMQLAGCLPSWMPTVETGSEQYRWRRLCVYDIAADRVCQLSNAECNVWEAVWCGNDAVAAVVSSGPAEGLWYSARLHTISLDTCKEREIHRPQNQIGCLAASPSGKHLAIVEAICSDRWIVAGDLNLVDPCSGEVQRVNTNEVDITYAEWRSDCHLLLAGHRGLESVVSFYDTNYQSLTEVWSSCSITTGGRYISVSGFGEPGDCALVGESFVQAPEVAAIRHGVYGSVKSFALGNVDQADFVGAVEHVCWNAPDGLEIQGWVLRPKDKGPHPLILDVHAGPVWHWRPRWLGRASVQTLMLLKRGYAIFLPNSRGSVGRGQAFIRHILGDMGGADTYDYLSGLDHLVELGMADPKRLGVTGGSYGGFMTSWLITQDARFAAAVPVAPVTNHVTDYLISNIPHFVKLFLADSYNNSGGKFFQRSPIMHAQKVKTPTLNIAGALDRCTPPEEAVQFHQALLDNGVKSLLVIYPEEGHGIRKYPAAIDFAARLVTWFEQYMGGGIKPSNDEGCKSSTAKH